VPQADLRPFLQRRELMAYEQRLARRVYAYGVDTRRSAMLQGSTLGEPIMRAVDRRWRETTEALGECLEPQSTPVPSPVMEELTALIHQLRAPTPSVRLLRASQTGKWPIATPLSTTRGGVQWLLLDLERLTTLPELHRRFVLASSLAHLQCDHGPLFAAHLIPHLRGAGLGVVRRLLSPWTRVAYFSADRAGLLTTRDLAASLEALEATASPQATWAPRPPAVALRRQALEDFDHADVMARVRLLADVDPSQWGAVAATAARSSAPMAGRLSSMLGSAIRVGGKLMYTLDGGSFGSPEPADGTADEGDDAKPDDTADDEHDDAEPRKAAAPPPPPPPLDPELERKIEAVVAAATSLARCDESLTRRLRLL
jgi:hypothetical protein